jgi:hypothetical protein
VVKGELLSPLDPPPGCAPSTSVVRSPPTSAPPSNRCSDRCPAGWSPATTPGASERKAPPRRQLFPARGWKHGRKSTIYRFVRELKRKQHDVACRLRRHRGPRRRSVQLDKREDFRGTGEG